ncbi:hypothetical protein QFZ73_005147 [Peribacillus sp. V2I11]|nr:hypothetical protein [Peribacillus sp. V2I11]
MLNRGPCNDFQENFQDKKPLNCHRDKLYLYNLLKVLTRDFSHFSIYFIYQNNKNDESCQLNRINLDYYRIIR